MKKRNKLHSVIQKAIKSAEPGEKEKRKVNQLSMELKQIINEQAERQKIDCKLMIGGSVAKETWLSGIHDIDCFLRFNYKKYKKKSDGLSDIAEKLIKDCFSKYDRLHGSRDYFQIKYKGIDVEIIPVLKIKNPRKMKNITDVSPLHFFWLNSQARSGDFKKEIRLSKKFFKANNIYGAESFIRGFSGHVIEVLTIHYGGFLKLMRAVSKWGYSEIIDPEGHYVDRKQLMLLMNDSKLTSPLIIVDPIQPERNASAVISDQNFKKLKYKARHFLDNPSEYYFKNKKINLSKLKSKKTKSAKIILKVVPEKGLTIDIAGCKILKQFNYVKSLLDYFGFKTTGSGWYWNKRDDALLWFYVDKKKLSKRFRHWGPPKKLEQHAKAFREEWRGYRIKSKKSKLYVDLPRKVRTVKDFLKELKKDKKVSAKIVC